MVKTTNLRLNLDKPDHRKAYDILKRSEMSHTKLSLPHFSHFPKMKKAVNTSLTESEKLSERR